MGASYSSGADTSDPRYDTPIKRGPQFSRDLSAPAEPPTPTASLAPIREVVPTVIPVPSPAHQSPPHTPPQPAAEPVSSIAGASVGPEPLVSVEAVVAVPQTTEPVGDSFTHWSITALTAAPLYPKLPVPIAPASPPLKPSASVETASSADLTTTTDAPQRSAPVPEGRTTRSRARPNPNTKAIAPARESVVPEPTAAPITNRRSNRAKAQSLAAVEAATASFARPIARPNKRGAQTHASDSDSDGSDSGESKRSAPAANRKRAKPAPKKSAATSETDGTDSESDRESDKENAQRNNNRNRNRNKRQTDTKKPSAAAAADAQKLTPIKQQPIKPIKPPSPIVYRSPTDSDGWTASQVIALQIAHASAIPTEKFFWKSVASYVSLTLTAHTL